MGIIYMLTSPSEKKYIGQTIQSFSKRMKQHRNKSDKTDNCTALYSAIIKYGFENFKTEIILICDDEDLNKYEKEFIKTHNTLSPNGYNLTTGGDSDYKVSESTRKKLSEIAKKKWELEDLPMYLGTVRKDGKLIGYKVRFHP